MVHKKSISCKEDNKPSGFSHSFDTGVARVCGLEAAVIYNHICHWIKFNKVKKEGFHDGRYWMYQSHEQISEYLEYLSVRQVKHAMGLLLQHGFLIKGNYNKDVFNKTNWYALPDEKILGNSNNSYESTEFVPSNGHIAYDRWDKKRTIENTLFVPSNNKEEDKKIEDKNNNTHPTLSLSESDPEPPKPKAPDGAKPAKAGRVCVDFGEYVKMTKEEHKKLCDENTQAVIDAIIEEMNDYCLASRPKGYSDYAAAIRQWLRKRTAPSPSKPRQFAPSSNQQKALDNMAEMRKHAI
jgi:hypothetical protein